MKKLSTKELNRLSKRYILDCIASDDHDIFKLTEKNKLEFLFERFTSEKDYEIRINGPRIAFSDWCMGLPSCFNIEFENYKILKLAKKWGSLAQNATEKEEEKILSNYWNFITTKTFQLFNKHGIA